jgi:hypothetical protein
MESTLTAHLLSDGISRGFSGGTHLKFRPAQTFQIQAPPDSPLQSLTTYAGAIPYPSTTARGAPERSILRTPPPQLFRFNRPSRGLRHQRGGSPRRRASRDGGPPHSSDGYDGFNPAGEALPPPEISLTPPQILNPMLILYCQTQRSMRAQTCFRGTGQQRITIAQSSLKFGKQCTRQRPTGPMAFRFSRTSCFSKQSCVSPLPIYQHSSEHTIYH